MKHLICIALLATALTACSVLPKGLMFKPTDSAGLGAVPSSPIPHTWQPLHRQLHLLQPALSQLGIDIEERPDNSLRFLFPETTLFALPVRRAPGLPPLPASTAPWHNVFQPLPQAEQVLNLLAGMMLAQPQLRAKIVGHADATVVNGHHLSQQRAEHIRHYWRQQGLANNVLTVEGRGANDPLIRTASPHLNDRRLEIYLYAVR